MPPKAEKRGFPAAVGDLISFTSATKRVRYEGRVEAINEKKGTVSILTAICNKNDEKLTVAKRLTFKSSNIVDIKDEKSAFNNEVDPDILSSPEQLQRESDDIMQKLETLKIMQTSRN